MVASIINHKSIGRDRMHSALSDEKVASTGGDFGLIRRNEYWGNS